ncbi:MAG TPA: mitofilin family membrane protein [Candidatus Sulfotelmatobacter sp.]|jgi:hypothetical protein|nr:mitofilin family membrane protein [Candidatus Sulfotelmatobacter sp.]
MSQNQSTEHAAHAKEDADAPSPAALDTDAPAEDVSSEAHASQQDSNEDDAPARPRAAAVGGAFVNGALGGAAITVVVAAGVVAAWPMIKGPLLGADGSRLAVLERQTDELSQKVALLQGQVSNQSDGAGATLATGTNQRLNAIEQRLNSADEDPRLSSLSQKMDQTAADNAKMREELTQLRNTIPPEGTILRLAERAESAEKAAREISSQHAQAQALLLAVGQLRDAVDRGDPYDFELRAVRRITPPEEAATLDILAATAASGLPRRAALLNTFPLLAPGILRASVLPAGDGLWQRALTKLASLVSIRRIDGTGKDTASILARTEAAIRDGDLAKAAQELSALEGEPAAKADPWIRDAQARIAADRALSALSADAMADAAKLN